MIDPLKMIIEKWKENDSVFVFVHNPLCNGILAFYFTML